LPFSFWKTVLRVPERMTYGKATFRQEDKVFRSNAQSALRADS
jgi:hypothetical protein